jgi:hypothetical protein
LKRREDARGQVGRAAAVDEGEQRMQVHTRIARQAGRQGVVEARGHERAFTPLRHADPGPL